MSKKEEFKEFVRKNPSLVKYVENGTSTWQKFYEIYDLYGDDKEAWKEYIPIVVAPDLMGWIKNIDLDSVQNGVNNIQRVLGLFQDMKANTAKTEEYKPRPVYKHFED